MSTLIARNTPLLTRLRAAYEAGAPLEDCARCIGMRPRSLTAAWSRTGLTQRVVIRGHRHLRSARTQAGLTQEDAALRVGISVRSWRRYERGQILLAPGQLEAWTQLLLHRVAA